MIKTILKKIGLNKTSAWKQCSKMKASYLQCKIDKKMHGYMQLYGLEALDKIYKIFNNNNVKIWFEYGTLLGAYREKGFIPYDYDIDLGMYYKDYTPELERELFDTGFGIKRMFYKVENLNPSTKCLTEISLDYNGLQIDVFFYWKEKDNRIGYVYTGILGDSYAKKNMYAVRTSLLPVSNIEEVDFLGIKFGMPSNTKDCLKKLYGDTFMTPLKNSSYTQSNECIPYTELYGEMFGAW